MDRSANRKRRIDQFSALVWLAAGATVVTEARTLEYTSEFGPGPGFFPFWLGLVVIALGLALLVKSAFRPTNGEELALPGRYAVRQMFLVMASFFGFVFLAEPVGFLLGIGLLFLFLLVFVERRGWKFSLAVSVVSTLAFWVVFDRALQLQLPRGLLGLLD
ncbi:MAG: tripartite tricarboxylate transporter TctB family protein [Betaproteobacteria bacterium]|nr:tripartite tricarboxylate transporter TctB family protein [Betaproteobacteria bacterium]